MKIKKFSCLCAICLLLVVFACSFCGCDILSTNDAEWVNELSSDGMQANVIVYAESYTVSITGTRSVTYFGSGVIVKKDGDQYTLLTNNHVICIQSGYRNIRFTVCDFKGVEYDAELVAHDANYDLAVLTFSVPAANDVSYTPLLLAQNDPNAKTRVAAMGQPKGQFNCLTLGEVLAYGKSDLLDSTPVQSNVTFNVLIHSAPINTGSSGGALLNQALEIVGINFGTSENIELHRGCAIPVSKVKEFLAEQEIDLNTNTDTI